MDGVKSAGSGLKDFADQGREIGGYINEIAPVIDENMKEYAPETHAKYGDRVFRTLDDINDAGDKMGGWDRLGQVGDDIAAGKLPAVTAADKDNFMAVKDKYSDYVPANLPFQNLRKKRLAIMLLWEIWHFKKSDINSMCHISNLI